MNTYLILHGNKLSPEENQRITESTKLSYYDRVLEPLREGKVELDCKRRIFIVDGQTQQYFVRLFPNESCSCTTPTSQYPCRHILSAKFAIGMMDCSKKKKNVNELRRKNQAKRRGCKGPTNLKSKRLKNKKKEEVPYWSPNILAFLIRRKWFPCYSIQIWKVQHHSEMNNNLG